MIPISAVDVVGAETLVLEVLRSGMIAQGPMVKRFEDAFAQVAGVPHAVAVSTTARPAARMVRTAPLARATLLMPTPSEMLGCALVRFSALSCDPRVISRCSQGPDAHNLASILMVIAIFRVRRWS